MKTDLAAILSAIMWPLTALLVLFGYRKTIPVLVKEMTSRVNKLEIAGVSLEFAVAKPYDADSEKSSAASDFWQKAPSAEVMDSNARTFFGQLSEGGSADYALIDLSEGKSWLTSRLYIISILYFQIKGVKAFVFIETQGGIRKRYLGWASSDNVRWLLAIHYQWLEQAYLEAYNIIIKGSAKIVSESGRLGYDYDPKGNNASIDLLRNFLNQIQSPLLPPDNPNKWAYLESTSPTYEHGQWITGELIEKNLGSNLNKGYIRSSELRAKSEKEQLNMIVSMPDPYIVVVTDDYRFEYVLDRLKILEQSFRK